MARDTWVFDDIRCLLEAGIPVDALSGRAVHDNDGPVNVHYFSQRPVLSIRIKKQPMMQPDKMFSIVHL